MVWKSDSRGVLLMLLGLLGACGAHDARLAQPTAPLIENLGTHHHPISTSEPMAQRYFDQGMVLAWAFNHAEAARSFQAAQRLDPTCAMCYWGEALVLGPHINADMEPANVPRAWAALRRAQALQHRATPRERAYIEALAQRYTQTPIRERASLDEAYAAAMGEVVRQYPDDLDAATLYAEAIMDIHPWDYWSREGEPRPWTPDIVSTLESVIARDTEHIGANHLYIHALEASPFPERAIASADRLQYLVPAAGHLVHMPSHIYIRTGRYHEAAEANQRAIEVDRAYRARYQLESLYTHAYIPHNYHFLAAAATLEGRSELALAAARDAAAMVDRPEMRQPGGATLQHYAAMPLYMMARFGKWDEILATPAPPRDLIYPTAVWHYARGMAFTGKGRLVEASEELERLRALARDPALEGLAIWDVNQVSDLLAVAMRVLAGRLAATQRDFDKAVAILEEGVRLEDALVYDEPPAWPHPVRQVMGAVLLQAGRPAEAERVFRVDLLRYPENGWSLSGLSRSLSAQGKELEAAGARRRFDIAWARADIAPALSFL